MKLRLLLISVLVCALLLAGTSCRQETRADEKGRSLLAHELAVLLSGGDFEAAKSSPQWRRVSPSDASVHG